MRKPQLTGTHVLLFATVGAAISQQPKYYMFFSSFLFLEPIFKRFFFSLGFFTVFGEQYIFLKVVV